MFFDSFSFDGETFGIDKRVPTELESKLNSAGDTKRWNYMKATEEFVFIGGSYQLCQVSKEFFILSNQNLGLSCFDWRKDWICGRQN